MAREPGTSPPPGSERPAPPSAASVAYLNRRLARGAALNALGGAILLGLGAGLGSLLALILGAIEVALALFLITTRQLFARKYG